MPPRPSDIKKPPRKAFSASASASADIAIGGGAADPLSPWTKSRKTSKPLRPAARPASQEGTGVRLLSRRMGELSRMVSLLIDKVGAPQAAPAACTPSATAQALANTTGIRRPSPLAEKLRKRAVESVLQGTEWLTAKEVGARADPNAKNKYALATRLVSEKRIFAIEHAGQKHYPSYAFDPLGNPVPELRAVLDILDGYSAYRIASWFESTSSTLDGRRPREVLAERPLAVIAAARAQKEGPLHG